MIISLLFKSASVIGELSLFVLDSYSPLYISKTAFPASFAALIATIVGLIGPQLIEMVYGSSFEVGQGLTLKICASAWVLSFRGILDSFLLGRGHSTRALLANTTSSFVAFTAYFFIIPTNGVVGASDSLFFASLFALFATTVAFITVAKKGIQKS